MKQCWPVVSTVADLQSDRGALLRVVWFYCLAVEVKSVWLCLAISQFRALICFPSWWVFKELPIAFKQLNCCQPFRQSHQGLCWQSCGFTARLLRSSQFPVHSHPSIGLGNFSLWGSWLLSLLMGSHRTTYSLQTGPPLLTISSGAVIFLPPVFSLVAYGAVVSNMQSLL